MRMTIRISHRCRNFFPVTHRSLAYILQPSQVPHFDLESYLQRIPPPSMGPLMHTSVPNVITILLVFFQ